MGWWKSWSFPVRYYGQPKNNPKNNIHNPTEKKKKIGKKFGYLTKIHGHPYILATSEWPVSTWKRAHCLIIREMQSKTTKKYHSGHIRYTLEWLKLDTTPNVSKNKKQTELSSITGSVKWSIHFGERSVPVPWYISNPAILRQWSRIFTFDFYSKWFWWFLPTRKKNVHTDLITFIKVASGNTIHNTM